VYRFNGFPSPFPGLKHRHNLIIISNNIAWPRHNAGVRGVAILAANPAASFFLIPDIAACDLKTISSANN